MLGDPLKCVGVQGDRGGKRFARVHLNGCSTFSENAICRADLPNVEIPDISLSPPFNYKSLPRDLRLFLLSTSVVLSYGPRFGARCSKELRSHRKLLNHCHKHAHHQEPLPSLRNLHYGRTSNVCVYLPVHHLLLVSLHNQCSNPLLFLPPSPPRQNKS